MKNTNDKSIKTTSSNTTNSKSRKNPNAGKVLRVINGKRKFVAVRSNPTNQRDRASFNYSVTKVGAIKFHTASAAIIHMLKNTKLSQSEIARRVGVSQPCVCQLARDVVRKK